MAAYKWWKWIMMAFVFCCAPYYFFAVSILFRKIAMSWLHYINVSCTEGWQLQASIGWFSNSFWFLSTLLIPISTCQWNHREIQLLAPHHNSKPVLYRFSTIDVLCCALLLCWASNHKYANNNTQTQPTDLPNQMAFWCLFAPYFLIIDSLFIISYFRLSTLPLAL